MKKLMNKAYMKASLLAGGALCSAGSLFAQEGSGATLDTTQATNAATQIKTGLVSVINSVAPIVVDVILAVLGIVVIYKVVRWVMRAWNSR